MRSDIYPRMRSLGERLASGIVGALESRGCSLRWHRVTVPCLQFICRARVRRPIAILSDRIANVVRFRSCLLDEGVLILPDGRWYISAAHSERDIDEALGAVERAARIGREGGRVLTPGLRLQGSSYQSSLMPNWMFRIGDMVLVMAPTPPEIPACDGNVTFPFEARVGRNPPCVLRVEFGMLNCGVFKKLKNSLRNWSFTRSVMPKFLNRDMSTFLNPGPSMMPFPAFP